MKEMMTEKRGIVLSKVIKWLIAIGVFILLVGLIALLIGKGSGALAYLADKLRFWG